jgi:hypothetical protein
MRGRTWFPILLGVLSGMVAWVLLAAVGTRPIYHLSVWILRESPPPTGRVPLSAHYCVYRALLLALAAIGGTIGIPFSRWRKRTAFLFLLASLAVVAVFAALGFH